ncbi:MAG TPA: NADP-dependent oxidoreductase, partial [Verrucomicrobiae bacterium]|nr:NADP-dependent oxidoreductase [Verrucomicrobiae bacterium]
INLLRFVALIAILPLAAAAQSSMKAIVVHSSGGPDVLKYEDAPRPHPKDDEVLIRVMAAAVNPVDVFIREGRSNQFPLIPGMDVAGVVEQAGNTVTKFKPGAAVYAYLSFEEQGGYAEFAVAKQDHVALKPRSIDFEHAAAVPLAATTAWQALVEKAGLSAGQTVLIHGGSGGVGTFAVQIAKARGAKVIATASTANQDLLKELGVDQSIDYTTTKFEDVVKDVDVVLNAVRGDTLGRSYSVVKKGGIIVSITGQPDPGELQKHGIRGAGLGAHPDAKVLEELAKLIDAGKITPIVSAVVPLADVAKAHEQIASRHTRGKIVLKIAEPPK